MSKVCVVVVEVVLPERIVPPEVRVSLRGLADVRRGARDGGPPGGPGLERVERGVGLGRREHGRARRAGVHARDREALRRGPRPLIERAVDRLDAPEIGAVRQAADDVLGGRAVDRVLVDDRASIVDEVLTCQL